MEAAGGGGKGGEPGEPNVMEPRADPFDPAEYSRVGMSVVEDILEVSDTEAKDTGSSAVAGVQRQPAAPNVPAAAMKSILGTHQAWG